jgi:hypothetical protein
VKVPQQASALAGTGLNNTAVNSMNEQQRHGKQLSHVKTPFCTTLNASDATASASSQYGNYYGGAHQEKAFKDKECSALRSGRQQEGLWRMN